MITLTLQDAYEQLSDLAEANPNVKADCRYFTSESKPQCIVGHYLFRRGVTPDMVSPSDNVASIWYLLSDDGADNSQLRLREHVMADDLTLEFLAVVQAWQDSGSTWSEAVERGAKDFLSRHEDIAFQLRLPV